MVLAREHGPIDFADIALAAPTSTGDTPRAARPRIGLALRGAQGEYGPDRCLHGVVESIVSRLREAFPDHEFVHIEHRLADTPLTPEATEALYASCHAVVTTRLHGALLSLRNGTPVVAIDQIAGGAKVWGVMSAWGWPLLHLAETCSPEDIEHSLTVALSGDLMHSVEDQRERLVAAAKQTLDQLVAVVRGQLAR